jgi:hypothetical protein
MTTMFGPPPPQALFAVAALFEDETLYLLLDNGHEVCVPAAKLRQLRRATPQERENVRVVHSGAALRWEDLDTEVDLGRLLALA